MNLNQVTVPSIDVEKSILFYKKLGLQLIVKSLPKYARFECPNGDTTFSIHQVASVTESQSVWVYFEVENVNEKVSELQSKGITFETTPVEQSWLWIEAKLKDPDGNQIMIYHAGKNRKNPPWRI